MQEHTEAAFQRTYRLIPYDFTEDGYRTRFRGAAPEQNESPEQFID